MSRESGIGSMSPSLWQSIRDIGSSTYASGTPRLALIHRVGHRHEEPRLSGWCGTESRRSRSEYRRNPLSAMALTDASANPRFRFVERLSISTARAKRHAVARDEARDALELGSIERHERPAE
jgi:hypothetical protein